MDNGSSSRRVWPALDIRLPVPGPSLLHDLLPATVDDFEPSAIQEDEGGSFVRVFFGSAATRDGALAAVTRAFGPEGVEADPVDVPDEDWAVRSQAGLRAVTAGRIIVAPPWDIPASPREGTIVVVIRPSMGFGTGHHASTRLCLLALQRLDLPGKSVIDVGTGSGVLAIAGVRLGASHALGLDVDRDALESARENVELNGVGSSVHLELGDFVDMPGLNAPVVLANLTGGMLARCAGDLTALVAPGGCLVVGGFMESETSVLPALETTMSRVHLDREDEWQCAVLQKQ